ncbi:MAG: V-type ATP synthase subunit F [Oscillospiraceae bacterium]|nr:V-type ATP synthase subunit F [Oscillospiraceae bacterium]
MKLFLISDDNDALTGMRLAGIEGVLATRTDEVKAAVETAINDKEIGILLITESLAVRCVDLIFEYKLNLKRHLIVEIPSRNTVRHTDSITRYVRDALGVKI